MKNIIFINTHLGSGADKLMSALSENKHIQEFKGFAPFYHPDDLYQMTNSRHKCNNISAIYMHGLWDNKDWVRKPVRKISKFIHLIREPKFALNEMKKLYPKHDEIHLERYYCLRLRGIYEMWQLTPNSVVMNVDNLNQFQLKEMFEIDRDILFQLTEQVSSCSTSQEAYNRFSNLLNL